ncbi:TcaA 3rd/4th domain-containing protein [Clostridium sp.]|uniref:TcaA 3rd/4th domain-containing protein n=1 Tax=Clostridium sp. TaxID=1506 RepID=UPI003990A36E
MKETIKELFLKISNNIKIEGKNIRIKVYIIILILALVSIVFNITKPMSKKELINQLEMALLKGKENWVERNIKIDGAKAENDELKPLIYYYLLNNKDVEQVISNLKKNNNSGNLTIESEKSLLGENYYLNLSTISINITSDIKEAIIYINGREVNKEELVSLIPGTYEVAYKLKTDYGDVEETKEMDILSSGDVKIEVAAEYITLYSNFSDAKVYINEKDTKKTVSEIKKYGPIPNNKDITIYIAKDFPWGVIKSPEIKVQEDNILKIDINMANDELLATIENTLREFYNSLFDALNNKDSSLIENVEENSREEVFNSIYEKPKVFANNYTISDLELKIANSEFKYENEKYVANILVDMDYSVAKKILPFIKEQKEERFLLSLIYNEEKWLVESSQRIELKLEGQ